MSRTVKVLVAILLILLLSVSAMIGWIWVTGNNVIVNKRLYPKDSTVLDLRGEDFSSKDYEQLQRKLPDCQILWNVDFQGTYHSSDTKTLVITALSDSDIEQLHYFTNLKAIDARECTDTDAVFRLMEAYPELIVRYQVPIGGRFFRDDTQTIELSSISEQDLALLSRMPLLHTVSLADVSDGASAKALHDYCQENGIAFHFQLGDTACTTDTDTLTLTGATEAQLPVLDLLPNLKTLHLVDPAVSPEALLSLRQTRSDLAVTWEKTICGLTFRDSTVDVDLSEVYISSLEEVEQGMAYLPNLKSLYLGLCDLDNEEIAAYRERSRGKFKVVWAVDLSGKMVVRTDIDNFMPSRDGWGYVRDHEVDNIRYCEDLICIDLGHMGIKDTSFLEPLVNLEYLILAHTEITNVNGLKNAKKLKYLELDWSPVQDLSALAGCTALEDLNIGKSWPDITPLLEMPWLKNVYMIHGRQSDAWKISQALPDTRVVATGEYTVSSGWRQLPNYYAMRDILGMHYM